MRHSGSTHPGRSHSRGAFRSGRPASTHLARSSTAVLLSLALVAGSCRSTGKGGDADAQPGEEPTPSQPTPQPGSAQDIDARLREDAEMLSLKQQRQSLLLEQALANATALREQLRLPEARATLQDALATLDPDALEVKKLLAEVEALMGIYPGEVETVASEVERTYELRVQKMKAEARDGLRKGRMNLARGEYDAAIADLTIAQNQMRWSPYAIDWEGMDEEAKTLLERAKGEKRQAEETRVLEAQRQAYEQLLHQEQAERTRRQAMVDNMLDQAIEAFDQRRYDDAMYFAEQALRRDPRNERAEDIRTSAFKAGREQVRSQYIERKREEYRRWQAQMNEMRIPWTEVITLPDQDLWAENSKRRSKRSSIDLAAAMSEGERALRAELTTRTVRLAPVRDEDSLRRVVDTVRLFTGLPIVVDPAAEEAVISDGRLFTFSFENELTVQQALNLLADMAGENVTWIVRHETVLFTTTAKAQGEPIVVHHDVQDLVFQFTDFLGPRIDRIRLLNELEDDDGGGPFGGIGEKPTRVVTIDELTQMIQDNVAVGTWDGEGISIDSYGGHILIAHTPEVQDKVRKFLEDMRRFSSSLVTIDSKFMTVGDNWIQEIGVDLRGLDNNPLTDVTNGLEDMASLGLDNSGTGSAGQNAAGAPSPGFYYDDGQDGDFRGRTENFFTTPLGRSLSTVGGMTTQLTFLNDIELSAILRAVEKSSQYQLVNNQVLSVYNSQNAYVTVINQRAYIQDFDVEVAQFQAVADPQVNVLTEGVVLQVRPTIHHDRKYLTLEVQPTVAKVVNLRNFSTTLGGNTSPVEFQLPELAVQSVFTTATIPDGGSILLGGLSKIRNIERRAEVPWLGKIPLVGFFFKREGYADENETLLILIRARITDVREEVSRLERRY